MFSSFKNIDIQHAGIRLWSFAGLFLYVRIVFTAASSVINDSVLVKYLWNFLPPEKVPFHSLTEMDGNKKEREKD